MNKDMVRPESGQTSLGLALSLCSIPGVMAAIVLVPIMPEIFRAYGSVPNANFWLPALVTIPGFCSALLSPLAGYLGDRIALKWPIIISLLLYAGFGSAPFFFPAFTSVLVTRIGMGVAQVGALVFSIAMISRQFAEQERDRWLALQAAAATSSSIVFLPLSGIVADSSLGWRASFLIFLVAIALALSIAVLRVARRVAPREDHGTAGLTLPWAWLLGQCVITCISGVFFFSAQLQLGLALASVGIKDTASIGMLSALAAAGVVLGSFLFAAAKRRFGAWLLPLELVVCGVTLFLMWQFQTVHALVGLAFVNMVACGMMLPTLVTSVASGLPDTVRGRGLGLWNSAFVLAQFVSSGFIGLVLSQPGATVLDGFGILSVPALALAAVVGLRVRKSGA